MPFKSEKQRRWMWAKKPEMARRWTDEEKKVAKNFTPWDGITSEVSKMSQEHKDDANTGAEVVGGGAAAAVGTKYATGARALKVASKNPQRVARLAQQYQHANTGRRALTLKGWADNKVNPDLVKRKLNHGITHWEDASGVKLNRKIRANPDSKLLRLHPRYAEHKILNQAVAAAPASHKNLYRGVTMHPSEAAQLKTGNHMQRSMESWTDDKRKAKVFADNRRAKTRSARDHVRVVYKMPKGSKALNIQGQSNWNMSEWVADQPYKIARVKQTKKGNYKVKVKQSQLSPVQKSYASLNMNEGVRSEVSKMGPDQSELHVVGNSGQRKKLRKLPPSEIRRVQ